MRPERTWLGMSGTYSGYHDCPCRDCFEIAIGGQVDSDGDYDDDVPGLCNECEEAGCSPEGDEECEAPHAYGATCGDSSCCRTEHL